MAGPLQSSYAAVLDTMTGLSLGSLHVTTTLTDDLDAAESFKALIADGGSADARGTMKIEDEIIYYYNYDPTEPDCVLSLRRGQEGTDAVTHLKGAEVALIGFPRFVNPAIPEAIVALQEAIGLIQNAPQTRGAVLTVGAAGTEWMTPADLSFLNRRQNFLNKIKPGKTSFLGGGKGL